MTKFCSECGAPLSPSNTVVLDTGEEVCSHCVRYYSSKFERCSNCGRHYRTENGGCSRCKNTVYDRIINSYGTKPMPIFTNKKGIGYNGNRFYGLELEFANLSPSYAYTELEDMYKDKRLYNKSDGSISSGVEIVTNPCDYTSIKKLIMDMDSLLSKLDNKETKQGAGVHIHVNRKSIDPIDIYKLFYLFDVKNSDCKVENLFMYLVGRHDTSTIRKDIGDSYCKLGKGELEELNECRQNSDRHSAINLRNSNTIEFRMFKSNTDPNTIIGYVDLVNMAIDFCHSSPMNKVNLNNFILYIKCNSKDKNILKKIKNFESRRGKIEPKQNIFRFDTSVLKGIKYDKFRDVATILRIDRCSSRVIRFIENYKTTGIIPSTYGCKTYDNKVADRLEETYKKVLISKIMKEVQQCA